MKPLFPSLLLVAALGAGGGALALAQPGPEGPPPHVSAGDDHERGQGSAHRGPGGAEGRSLPSPEEMAAVLRDIDPALADRLEARRNDRGGERGLGNRGERGSRGERGGPDGPEGRSPEGRGGREGRAGPGREGVDGINGVRELFPQIARLVRLKEVDKALYDLRVKDIRLERDTERIVAEGKRIRGDASIDDADGRLKDLHDELEEKVEAHFELRQEIRAAELERMEKRLEELKDDLDRRKDDKKALIAQRLSELRGTPEAW